MKNIMIDQNISIYIIDNISVITCFVMCLMWIISGAILFFIGKLLSNFSSKKRILRGGYISLLLWENRICIKNAKSKCLEVMDNQTLEKIYEEIFGVFKRYGFYTINQYQLNREDSIFNFGNMWIPISITFVTNFICSIFEMSSNEYMNMTIAIILTFVAMVLGPELDALVVHKDFINGSEMLSLFYDKYPQLKAQKDFNLNYLSVQDKDCFDKNLGKYLKTIKKIQKAENRKIASNRIVDIFSFSKEELKEQYGLNIKQIEIYCKFKELREKHIQHNSYKI